MPSIKKVSELEQYSRRVCHRIEGVEHQVNEKSEEVLEKVMNIIKESEAEILESVLDRADRIGPTYTNNNTGKKMQSKIVRFTEPYFMQITKILNLVPELD